MPHHDGIDIANSEGTSISAAMDGKVLSFSADRVFGVSVKIEHRFGIITEYNHLDISSTILEKGMPVKQGGIVGKMGDTGFATGSHLDFRIRDNGKAVNPLMSIKLPEGISLDNHSVRMNETGIIQNILKEN